MGATIFRDHKVFKMDLGLSDGSSMFGSETVIVVSDHCEKNCYPHTYKTSIEFIGSADKFSNSYIPKAAYYFNDGLSQCATVKNGTAFQKLMQKLFAEARPLTLNDLHAMGFYGYSWCEEEARHISDRSNLKTFTYWLGTRCASRVDTEADMHKMIQEAYEILSHLKDDIWMSRLWSLQPDQVAKLQQAENGTRFKSF